LIGDAEGMLELVWLLFVTVLAWVRPRHDLVLENLLLRHQLAVLTRPSNPAAYSPAPLGQAAMDPGLSVLCPLA